jgi:hypothetical protein
MKDKHIFGGKALVDSLVTISLLFLLLNLGTLFSKLLPNIPLLKFFMKFYYHFHEKSLYP